MTVTMATGYIAMRDIVLRGWLKCQNHNTVENFRAALIFMLFTLTFGAKIKACEYDTKYLKLCCSILSHM